MRWTRGDRPAGRAVRRQPFLARELVVAGALDPGEPYAAVPPSLRDILDAGLVALDDGTLGVLRAAALDPGPIDDEVLASVVGRPVGRVGDALRESIEAGVLAPPSPTPRGAAGGRAAGAGAPRFRHVLQREMLVDRLGPGERRTLHARFADALETASPDPRARPRSRSIRTPRAMPRARSRPTCGVRRGRAVVRVRGGVAPRGAGGGARAEGNVPRAGAADAAGAPLAPQTWPAARTRRPRPAWLLERASGNALLAGDPVAAAELARRGLALAAATRVGRGAPRPPALGAVGGRRPTGRPARLELALDGLGEAPAPALRARLTAEWAAVRMEDADPSPVLALTDEALAAARSIEATDVEALALGVRGRTLAMHGRVDEGVADLRAAVRLADGLGSLQGRLVGRRRSCRSWPLRAPARAGGGRCGAGAAEASGLRRSLGAAPGAGRPILLRARRLAGGGPADRRRRPAAGRAGGGRAPDRGVAAGGRPGRVDDAAAAERGSARSIGPRGPEDRAALDVARAEPAGGGPAGRRPGLLDRPSARPPAAPSAASLAWLGALAIRRRWNRPRRPCAGSRRRGTRGRRRIEAIAELAARRPAPSGQPGARARRRCSPTSRRSTHGSRRRRMCGRGVAARSTPGRRSSGVHRRLRQAALAEALLAAGADRQAIGEPLGEAAGTLRDLGAAAARPRRAARTLARVDLAAGTVTAPATTPRPAPSARPA
jgi:hypothetical protein